MTGKCYCDSDLSFHDCCEPFLSGEKLPQTSLQLMRSRYTAFVLNKITYIQATMRGEALKCFDYTATELWSKSVTWLGLTIISVGNAEVTFDAKYKTSAGNIVYIQEVSKFQRYNNKWYYVSGKKPKKISDSVYTNDDSTVKVGRNASCPCGSGKKYKKCCYLIREK